MRKKALVAVFLATIAVWPTCRAEAQDDWVTAQHHNGRLTAYHLMRLAQDGDLRAQARLCFLYQAGLGVVQSFAMAATYCRSAAERGEANAQYLLGLMYDKGQGVGRDVVLAYMWLDLAAAGGSPSVRAAYARIRDAVATKMTPAQLQYGQALALAHALGQR